MSRLAVGILSLALAIMVSPIVTTDAQAADACTTFTYDAQGNRIAKQNKAFDDPEPKWGSGIYGCFHWTDTVMAVRQAKSKNLAMNAAIGKSRSKRK